ncbi:hypothetical protein [Tenacibaculum sp. MAR_2009_124]|uniref:hypothetical protein n=1 Tax=Tenacibaculum sp. MAR_2009_124 TaxID=1250059 RepID=UPI00115F869B|nr:hypothetical protein [Tenacibaculum sp. MAR_2009_124]
MIVIKIRQAKKTSKRSQFIWKEKKPEKGKSTESLILDLKKEKKCFKVISDNYERHYQYNGNNYIISESPKK